MFINKSLIFLVTVILLALTFNFLAPGNQPVWAAKCGSCSVSECQAGGECWFLQDPQGGTCAVWHVESVNGVDTCVDKGYREPCGCAPGGATATPVPTPPPGGQICSQVGSSCTDDYPENCDSDGNGSLDGTRWCHKVGTCQGIGGGEQCSWGPGSYCGECVGQGTQVPALPSASPTPAGPSCTTQQCIGATACFNIGACAPGSVNGDPYYCGASNGGARWYPPGDSNNQCGVTPTLSPSPTPSTITVQISGRVERVFDPVSGSRVAVAGANINYSNTRVAVSQSDGTYLAQLNVGGGVTELGLSASRRIDEVDWADSGSCSVNAANPTCTIDFLLSPATTPTGTPTPTPVSRNIAGTIEAINPGNRQVNLIGVNGCATLGSTLGKCNAVVNFPEGIDKYMDWEVVPFIILPQLKDGTWIPVGSVILFELNTGFIDENRQEQGILTSQELTFPQSGASITVTIPPQGVTNTPTPTSTPIPQPTVDPVCLSAFNRPVGCPCLTSLECVATSASGRIVDCLNQLCQEPISCTGPRREENPLDEVNRTTVRYSEGGEVSFNDSCFDQNNLQLFYCDPTTPGLATYDTIFCPASLRGTICQNGACVGAGITATPTPSRGELGGSCMQDTDCRGFDPNVPNCGSQGKIYCYADGVCRRAFCDVGECHHAWLSGEEYHSCQVGLTFNRPEGSTLCCPSTEPDCEVYCTGITPTPTPEPDFQPIGQITVSVSADTCRRVIPPICFPPRRVANLAVRVMGPSQEEKVGPNPSNFTFSRLLVDVNNGSGYGVGAPEINHCQDWGIKWTLPVGETVRLTKDAPSATSPPIELHWQQCAGSTIIGGQVVAPPKSTTFDWLNFDTALRHPEHSEGSRGSISEVRSDSIGILQSLRSFTMAFSRWLDRFFPQVLAQGNQGVSGAQVTIKGGEQTYQTTTDESGYYGLAVPGGVEYLLTITAEGYKTLSLTTTPATDKNYTANFTLEKGSTEEKGGTPEIGVSAGKINLKAGWNLVGLNVKPNETVTMQGLLSGVNDAGGIGLNISQWDPINNRWESYTYGIAGADLPLQPGQGVMIRSQNEWVYEVQGSEITQPIPLVLSPGLNTVSIPYPPNTYTAATTIDGINKVASGAADEVTRFESGLYESFIKQDGQDFGQDFPIESNRGYFIKVNQGVTWTP